jgi:transglutaminase-like putative cysteine protease
MSGSGQGPELLSSVSAKLVGKMPKLTGQKQMQYRLSFPDTTSFQLNSGRQSYRDGLLTITLESLADYAKRDEGAEPADAAYLAPTASVQSTAPAIQKLAVKLCAGKSSDLAKVKAVADYVYNYLEKRPVLGIPDALTVLKSGKGDCNEHSVLFTAIARAAGIPTRMVAGVLFFKGAFYYHAWNEVRIAGKWLSVDATTDQLPADLGHIKFVEGGLKEQMRIGALLGRLSIEPIQGTEDRRQGTSHE